MDGSETPPFNGNVEVGLLPKGTLVVAKQRVELIHPGNVRSGRGEEGTTASSTVAINLVIEGSME